MDSQNEFIRKINYSDKKLIKKNILEYKFSDDLLEKSYKTFLKENECFINPIISWLIFILNIFKLGHDALFINSLINLYFSLFFVFSEILFLIKIYSNGAFNIIFLNKESKKAVRDNIRDSEIKDFSKNQKISYYLQIRMCLLLIDYFLKILFIYFSEIYIENKQFFLIKLILMALFLKNVLFPLIFSFNHWCGIFLHLIFLVILLIINIKFPFMYFVEIKNKDVSGNFIGNSPYIVINFAFCLVEIFLEICLFIFSLLIKKNYNLFLRSFYLEKTNIEEYLKFTEEIINGLNCLQMSYFNNHISSISKSLEMELPKIFNNNSYKNNTNNYSVKNSTINVYINKQSNMISHSAKNENERKNEKNQFFDEYIKKFLINMKSCKSDKLNLLNIIEFFTYEKQDVLAEEEINLENYDFKKDKKTYTSKKIKNNTTRNSLFNPTKSNKEMKVKEIDNSLNNSHKKTNNIVTGIIKSNNKIEEDKDIIEQKVLLKNNNDNINIKNDKSICNFLINNKNPHHLDILKNENLLKSKTDIQTIKIIENNERDEEKIDCQAILETIKTEKNLDHSESKLLSFKYCSNLNLNNQLDCSLLDKKKFKNNENKIYNQTTNFSNVIKYLRGEKILDFNHQNKNINIENVLEMNKEKLNHMKFLGDFIIKFGNQEKYFLVYFRKKEKNLDLLFYDITKIKISNNISIENKIKHKILSKIAHEFKTPLNSILGLIKNLKEINYNKNINKDLNLIQSLSNYTIYLISDVIQYASSESSRNNENQSFFKNYVFNKNYQNDSNNDVASESIKLNDNQGNYSDSNNFSNINCSIKNQINASTKFSNSFNYSGFNFSVINRKIEVRKIMFFCFDILNALLSCHESKKNSIKTELLIENKLKNFDILNDEIRINQIILNFISNSVKFTKKGKIAIVAQFVKYSEKIRFKKKNNLRESCKEEKILTLKEKTYFNNTNKCSLSHREINFEDLKEIRKINNFEILNNKSYEKKLKCGNNSLEKNSEFFFKISVIDTGMGISQKNQKNIFRDNLMMDTRYDFNQQGTGLGLSICMNLIKLLNLKIEFFSEVNKGSIFSLLIPAKKIKNSFCEDNNTSNNEKPISNKDFYLRDFYLEETKRKFFRDEEEKEISDKNKNNLNSSIINISDRTKYYNNIHINENSDSRINENNTYSNNAYSNSIGQSSKGKLNKFISKNFRTIEEINNSHEQNMSNEKKCLDNTLCENTIISNLNVFNENENLNNIEKCYDYKPVEEFRNCKISDKNKKSNFFKKQNNNSIYFIENNIDSRSKIFINKTFYDFL